MVGAPKAPRKVVLALIEHEGKFLLIKRRLPLFKVEWAFPGGIIEGEETEEEAVVREAQEEVSLDVRARKKLLERKHPNTLVQVVYFDCELLGSETEAKIGQEDEISEVEWVPAENVLERFTSDVHPVIREFILSSSRRGKEL